MKHLTPLRQASLISAMILMALALKAQSRQEKEKAPDLEMSWGSGGGCSTPPLPDDNRPENSTPSENLEFSM
jgi:hypothetical protein